MNVHPELARTLARADSVKQDTEYSDELPAQWMNKSQGFKRNGRTFKDTRTKRSNERITAQSLAANVKSKRQVKHVKTSERNHAFGYGAARSSGSFERARNGARPDSPTYRIKSDTEHNNLTG